VTFVREKGVTAGGYAMGEDNAGLFLSTQLNKNIKKRVQGKEG